MRLEFVFPSLGGEVYEAPDDPDRIRRSHHFGVRSLANYYILVSTDSDPQGPFHSGQIQQFAKEGKLKPDHMLRADDGEWLPAKVRAPKLFKQRKWSGEPAEAELIDTASNIDATPSIESTMSRKVAPASRNASKLRRSPLGEWAIYTASLGILLVIVTGRFFFEAISKDTSGLCIVIVVLFFIGLIKNAMDVMFLQSECKLVDDQISELRTANDVVSFLKVNESGIFYNHIRDLHQISKSDSEVEQDNLVGLLQHQLHSRARTTETLSGVLVTLGLVGTITGLISMTNDLGGVMESVGGNAEDGSLLENLKGVLSGMGTAFYTTLLGAILGSVVLKVLSSVYTSNAEHLVAHIAELTEVYIVPVLRRKARQRFKGQPT